MANTMDKKAIIIQFGSYDISRTLLRLCAFPNIEILPANSTFSLRRWREGKTYRRTIKKHNYDAFLKKLGAETFNAIELKIHFDKFRISENIQVVAISNALHVSPLSSLWGKVYGYNLQKHQAEGARMTFQSKELSLRWNEVSRYPNLLECLIEFESTVEDKQLINVWAQIIKENLTSSILDIGIFGCADIPDKIGSFNMLDGLAPYPKTYSQLDDKFDDPHQILIAQDERCQRLISAAGNHIQYAGSKKDSHGHNYGVVYVPAIQDIKNMPYNNLFVLKDASTAPVGLQTEKGEYKVDSHVFYTQRRLKELFEKKMMPVSEQKPGSFTYFPLVKDNYLSRLGLPPEEILMSLSQECFIDEFKDEVDRVYSQLSPITAEKERIWQAHEQGYKKLGYSQSIIAFIKTRILS